MKKHLFLIASVFAAVSLQAQAVVSVASDTGVKVKPNTLFYVGGKMKVDNYTNSAKSVSNEGKIKITGNLETQYTGTNNEASFVNEYINGNYGQLIVKNGTANVNHISSRIKAKDGFVFLPIAIPYSGVTAGDVVKNLFGEANLDAAFPGYQGKSGNFDKNRLKNALFFWHNNNFNFTQLAKSDELGNGPDAARYYAINTKYAGNAKFSIGSLKTIDGTPVNNDVTVTVAKTDLSKKKNTDINKYGEAYGSYITDFTRTMPTGWTNYHVTIEKGVKNDSDFGSRVYNLGNPFTSNINLAAKGNEFPWDKVEALVQYGSEDYTDAINEGQASGSKGGKITDFSAMTEGGAGDKFVGYVAPFGTFAVKMKDEGSSFTFKFTDKIKTFEGPDPSADGGSLVRTMFAKANGSMPVINQVGLDLYDAKSNFTGARTYIVASDIYEASQKGKGSEVYNPGITDESKAMYTLQEKEDGSVDESLVNARTYINGVNSDKYIGKPIHLVLQNIKGDYTLKARLNESLENNKNTFYFEDKVTGKVQKITKDFEYTFNINGTEKDRFVLYWAATPNKEKVEEVAKQEVSTTVVFKDADTYKVRFDKDIKKADVFVYNISGQLVNTERNINTSVDYIVPLKGNSSVYIIKIVGDNGQVTTKKVIK